LQRGQGVDHAFEQVAFLAQGLGFVRIVPDFGVFQFAEDFGQALGLGLEVKDTP
jgi:hypothetical protein